MTSLWTTYSTILLEANLTPKPALLPDKPSSHEAMENEDCRVDQGLPSEDDTTAEIRVGRKRTFEANPSSNTAIARAT